jgi:GrpB-like predicted nucleotidyltransferase (UPF0157 family)
MRTARNDRRPRRLSSATVAEIADRALRERLSDAGLDPVDPFRAGAGPWQIWLRLRDRWGRRATLVDLYALEAARRGIPPQQLPEADRARLKAAARPLMYPGRGPVPAGSDRPGDPHQVVPYDPGWPDRFRGWRDRLAGALGRVTARVEHAGPAAARIEHVGSTAVPGLAAKPIIDVQVSVSDVGDGDDPWLQALCSTGLILRMRETGHLLLWPPPGQPREVHVHVCAAGSAWEHDHLLLRDYLRAHPVARDAYGALKQELIATWPEDRKAYGEAKTAFLLDTLDAARDWAARSGWRA